MIDTLPKEIQDALTLLWKFSDDACLSGRTKEELFEEGYECDADSAHVFKFVISRRN